MAQVYQVSFTPHVTYAADIRANSPEEAESYVRQNWREIIVDADGMENEKLVTFVAEEVRSDEDGYEFDAAARSIVNRHGDEFFVGDTVCPREDDCVLYNAEHDEDVAYDSTDEFIVEAINVCETVDEPTLKLSHGARLYWRCPPDYFEPICEYCGGTGRLCDPDRVCDECDGKGKPKHD